MVNTPKANNTHKENTIMTYHLAHCHNKFEGLDEYGMIRVVGKINMPTQTCDTPETLNRKE